ncbi:MAG: MBL fold metallo-hydrolase [Chloroflexota bacterium]|jgi:flavorubredoxin|nr:MBL fold metallo-hydrolase [Chloroflexota bacterium]
MIRNIVGDVYQIGEYVEGSYGYEAVLVYVIMNHQHPILIDCGSQLHRAGIMQEINSLLAGHTPEYIFLTHSELPHAGNLQQVAKQWPNIKVIVSNVMLPYIEIAPILPLSQITSEAAGKTINIGGRTLKFVFATLKDQPGSQWVFDTQTGILFTGDGFGYYQSAEQIGKFSDEVEGGIREIQFRDYHRTAFHFLRWVLPEKFNPDLDAIFAQLPVKIIAPIHGDAIRSDIPTHVARLKQAVANIRNVV